MLTDASRFDRRRFLVAAAGAGAALVVPSAAFAQVAAQGLAPTETMRGGRNNYRPNAPVVETLGPGGFIMSGLVRRAGDGAPLEGVRIQIWAATVLGGEPDPRNHASVLTRADGTYRLDMPQIVPYFGQPHAHLGYDDGVYKSVFLRPVMASARETSMQVDFILAPA